MVPASKIKFEWAKQPENEERSKAWGVNALEPEVRRICLSKITSMQAARVASQPESERPAAQMQADAAVKEAEGLDMTQLISRAEFTRIVPVDLSMTGEAIGLFPEVLRYTGLFNQELLQTLRPIIFTIPRARDLQNDFPALKGKYSSATIIYFKAPVYSEAMNRLRTDDLVRLEPHYLPSMWHYTPKEVIYGEGLDGTIEPTLKAIKDWQVPKNTPWYPDGVEVIDWPK